MLKSFLVTLVMVATILYIFGIPAAVGTFLLMGILVYKMEEF